MRNVTSLQAHACTYGFTARPYIVVAMRDARFCVHFSMGGNTFLPTPFAHFSHLFISISFIRSLQPITFIESCLRFIQLPISYSDVICRFDYVASICLKDALE